MPDRMTDKRLEARVENLNRRFEQHGSAIRWEVQRRNGHVALARRFEWMSPGTSLDLVRVGTSGEIGEFLHAAMSAVDDDRRIK